MAYISVETNTAQTTQVLSAKQLIRWAKQFLSEAAKRRAIRVELGNLSEHHMRDIGFTKNDVIASTSLPLTFDSAQEL